MINQDKTVKPTPKPTPTPTPDPKTEPAPEPAPEPTHEPTPNPKAFDTPEAKRKMSPLKLGENFLNEIKNEEKI